MEQNYLNLLKDTHDIDFESLRELMNKYPWFSVLRMVWLLKHKKEKPELFPYELKKHIIYLHDRKQFYRILNHDMWQKLVHQELADDMEEEEDTSIENTEEYRNELLEFSYDPGLEETENNARESYSEKASVNNEKENPGNKNDFSAWIQKVENEENSGTNLIDRFLEIDPGPIRPDKETRLKGDISTHSIEENESFITDTLARIYIKQGLYSKAIFAYEKLSLKYPEKSIYFATQIEEIKKMINNK